MQLLKYLITFIITISIFIISLCIVSSIPRNNDLYNNCLESAKELVDEGGFYYPFLSWSIDNNSDAIIINESYCIDHSKPFESAMLMRRSYDPENTSFIIKEHQGNLDSYFLNSFDDNGEPIADYNFVNKNSTIDDYYSICKETLNFFER